MYFLAYVRQMRLKEARKLTTIGARLPSEQKELSLCRREGTAIGKDLDIFPVLRKEKAKEGIPWLNCNAATV